LPKNLPVKQKIASRENGNRKKSAPSSSLFVITAMSRATATRELNTIRTHNFPGDFRRVKTAATLASRVFIDQNGWFNFHNFLSTTKCADHTK